MEAIDLLEDIKALAEENTQAMTGSIHLAVEPFISNTIMVNALTTFKYRHPGVNVLMKVGESNNNLRDIAAGKADFGVVMKTCGQPEEKDLCIKELFRDRLVLLVSKDSELAGRGQFPCRKRWPSRWFCIIRSSLPTAGCPSCCRSTETTT